MEETLQGAEVFSVNLQLRLEHGTSRSREGFGLGLLPKRYRIYQAGVSVKMGLEHELCDGCSAPRTSGPGHLR